MLSAISVYWAVWVWALLWSSAIVVVLHLCLGRAVHWLVACVSSAGVYVALSLQLERHHPDDYLLGLRWALFAVALFTFVRYRFRRRLQDRSTQSHN